MSKDLAQHFHQLMKTTAQQISRSHERTPILSVSESWFHSLTEKVVLFMKSIHSAATTAINTLHDEDCCVRSDQIRSDQEAPLGPCQSSESRRRWIPRRRCGRRNYTETEARVDRNESDITDLNYKLGQVTQTSTAHTTLHAQQPRSGATTYKYLGPF